MGIYARRRIVNRLVMSLSVAATAFGLLWLVLVLWTLVENGIAAITPALFSQMTPPPGSAGGLLNAIFGSVAMTSIATLIGTPTGILAGTFLGLGRGSGARHHRHTGGRADHRGHAQFGPERVARSGGSPRLAAVESD